MNFIENFIGFLWGIVCTLIFMDVFIDTINYNLWYFIPLIVLIGIITIIGKIYLFVTDYKQLAESGLSMVQKIITIFFKNKYKIINK